MARKKSEKGSREKEMPRWLGIVLIVLIFISISETAYMLYIFVFEPPLEIYSNDSKLKETCLFYRKAWFCCEPYPWLKSTNLTSGQGYNITKCSKISESETEILSDSPLLFNLIED